jgi:hypothetical protein
MCLDWLIILQAMLVSATLPMALLASEFDEGAQADNEFD